MTVLLNPLPDYIDGKTAYPSTQLAHRFEGVEVDDGGKHRENVAFFVAMFHLLEGQGWIDHTGDWDFHVGVLLRDGTDEPHFGDGATLRFVNFRGEDVTDLEGTRFLWIETSDFHDEDEWDSVEQKWLPRQWKHPFDRYIHTPAGEEDDVVVWMIPTADIKKLTFGWCT